MAINDEAYFKKELEELKSKHGIIIERYFQVCRELKKFRNFPKKNTRSSRKKKQTILRKKETTHSTRLHKYGDKYPRSSLID
jgi:hypothetical protein